MTSPRTTHPPVGPRCDDRLEFEFALDLLLDGLEGMVTAEGHEAAVRTRYGPTEAVTIADAAVPSISVDEVLVRVRATAALRLRQHAGAPNAVAASGPFGWGVSEDWPCYCPVGYSAFVVFESGSGFVKFEAFGYDYGGGVPAYGVATHTCRTATCLWYGTATPLSKTTQIQLIRVSSDHWVHIHVKRCTAEPF